MIYKFDHKKLITLFLSSMKRRNIRVRWLVALLSYLKGIDTEFNSHLNGIKHEMKWNGQKILLERLLQLKFGSGILIENYDLTNTPLFLSVASSEVNPILSTSSDVDNPLISTSSSTAFHTVGFAIKIPAEINYDESAVRALVDHYLIGRSSYEVITY